MTLPADLLISFNHQINRNKVVRNKVFKSLISCALCLVIVCLIFSIFKGPDFVFVKYHYYKGFFKQNQGDLENAIKDYSKAIELDKAYPTAYISRGSAYVDLKQYDLAILDYSVAIEIAQIIPSHTHIEEKHIMKPIVSKNL